MGGLGVLLGGLVGCVGGKEGGGGREGERERGRWKGRWEGEGMAYGGHANLVAVGDVGVGCEGAGLCDGGAEGWGEDSEEGEGEGCREDVADHCEGCVLDCWLKGLRE